jgi:S-adenosylmethionine hydrolase
LLVYFFKVGEKTERRSFQTDTIQRFTGRIPAKKALNPSNISFIFSLSFPWNLKAATPILKTKNDWYSMKNHCITLLTDFGNQDGFAGIMKGVILSLNPAANIVDLSHKIPVHNIEAGAFVLDSAYRYFPPGTIHVAVVDPGVGSTRQIIACEAANYFFIAPDNGILKYIFQEFGIQKVIRITNADYFLSPISHTFHGRDIFAPVAAHLSLKPDLSPLGHWTRDFHRGRIPQLLIHENSISGEIIYIDHFGNMITNIPRQKFPDGIENHQITIRFRNHTLHGIRATYADGQPQELLGLWSSTGHLEIALPQDRAEVHSGLVTGDSVRLEWEASGATK